MIQNSKSIGVSSVIGFILIFSIVTMAFISFVVYTVPDLAQPAESDSVDQVHDEINKLRTTVDESTQTQRPLSYTVDTNVNYNPIVKGFYVPMQYNVRTPTKQLQLDNVQNPNSDLHNNTASYYNNAIKFDTIFGEENYHTIGVEHATPYYNKNDSVSINNQLLVDDKTITIPLYHTTGISGNFQDTTIKVNGTNYNKTTVNQQDLKLNLKFESQFSPSDWERALNDQKTENGGYVTDIREENSKIIIEMKDQTTYDIFVADVYLTS